MDGAAGLVPGDQAGGRQHVEMLEDGGQRHGEGAGEFADRQVGLGAQLRQQGAARGVGQGGEGAVERGVDMVNH